MTTKPRARWQFISLGMMTGAIALPLPAHAQITVDDTLGAERSQVRALDASGIAVDLIEQGAIRGPNLFHSFQDFNVQSGRGVYFVNPSNAIAHILARVTGSSRSEILGDLGIVNAPGITSQPNLFLMNPNGIIFGPNATLNVAGSFLATTADAIQLGDRGFFRATAPGRSALLNINPSALVFNRQMAQPIRVTSRAIAPNPISGEAVAVGLQVPTERSLLIIGGDVVLDGNLTLPAGQLTLAGVRGEGTVQLNIHDNRIQAALPAPVARGDVTLTDANVNAAAANGGSITLVGRHVSLEANSVLLTGILAEEGSTRGRSGTIVIDATGIARLDGLSALLSGVDPGVTGESGDIRITARSLFVTNSILLTTLLGRGSAGNIIIQAGDTVAFSGANSTAISGIENEGRGRSGNIDITARALFVTNGARLEAGTSASGNGGNVTIRTRDRISVRGAGSAIVSGVVAGGNGNGGTIRLHTGDLAIANGGAIRASTAGRGNAGDVRITATETVFLSGSDRAGNPSNISAGVNSQGIGNGGNITINTTALGIIAGGGIAVATDNRGNGGNLTVNARAGVLLDGAGANGAITGFISGVTERARGNSGDITVRTETLAMANGAGIGAGTLGRGNAGDVSITADTAVLTGISPQGSPTQIGTTVGDEAVGQAGSIRLTVGDLLVSNGAQLEVSTSGVGQGGNIVIQARDTVQFLGRGQAIAGVTPTGRGNGGEMTITGRSLLLAEAAQLTAATVGNGNGGNIRITMVDRVDLNTALIGVGSASNGNAGNLAIAAPSIRLADESGLNAASLSARGGSIAVRASDQVLLERNSTISAESLRRGNDGNIRIATGYLVAPPAQNSDIVAFSPPGASGSNIDINAQSVLGIQFREERTPQSDITATGTVTITTPDTDPNRGLVALPVNLVDATRLIAQGCPSGEGDDDLGEFVITGRGGLPPNPTQTLTPANPLAGLISPPNAASPPSGAIAPTAPVAPAVESIPAEAQGWITNEAGQIVLIARSPAPLPPTPPHRCN